MAALGLVVLLAHVVASLAVCANCATKYPTSSDRTCDVLSAKWADTLSCAEGAGCVAEAGALAGNCIVSQIAELGPSGLNCGADGRASVNCFPFKDLKKYNLTYSCPTTAVMACETYHLVGVCSPPLMQKYLNCYWNCAGNDFTRAFYAGACQASYRVTNCDYLEGTANYRQCYGINAATRPVALTLSSALLVGMLALLLP